MPKMPIRASISTLLLVAATPACTTSPAEEPSPSPTPMGTTPVSAAPYRDQPRYEPLPADFCEHINWEHLSRELHVTASDFEFVDWTDFDTAPDGALPWTAGCGFRAATDVGDFRPSVAISVDIYDNEEEARKTYQGWVAEMRHRGYEIDLADGWWDDRARATKHSRSGDYQFALTYHHIRHHNLYLETSIDGGYRVPDTTDEEFLDLLNQMSMALIDEVMDYLPCRPTADASPTPNCER